MKFFSAMIALFVFSYSAFAGTTDSAAGYWKTVDDKTGEVLSVVQIYPAGNTLEGKIVTIMPVLGQKNTDTCVKCKGSLQNKPMLGMRIMWNMQQVSNDTWGRGRVLDPKSGNVYQGTMKLSSDGSKLKLRGYIGVPVLGRSQTWLRTNNP